MNVLKSVVAEDWQEARVSGCNRNANASKIPFNLSAAHNKSQQTDRQTEKAYRQTEDLWKEKYYITFLLFCFVFASAFSSEVRGRARGGRRKRCRRSQFTPSLQVDSFNSSITPGSVAVHIEQHHVNDSSITWIGIHCPSDLVFPQRFDSLFGRKSGDEHRSTKGQHFASKSFTAVAS